jgi:hypothetical protein
MNEDNKCRNTSIMFLLFVCCGLILWGVFGSTYDWFTGEKLVVLMVMGSMFGRLAGSNNNSVSKYLVYGGAAGAIVIGMHLLPPYFWAARAVGVHYLTAYVITAMLAWGYLYKELRHANLLGKTYHLFTFLPLVIFASSLLAVNVFSGTLYASSLLSAFYLVFAVFLLIQAVKGLNKTKFNGSILMLCSIVFSFYVTVVFKLPEMVYVYAGIVVIFILNILFNLFKRRCRNK